MTQETQEAQEEDGGREIKKEEDCEKTVRRRWSSGWKDEQGSRKFKDFPGLILFTSRSQHGRVTTLFQLHCKRHTQNISYMLILKENYKSFGLWPVDQLWQTSGRRHQSDVHYNCLFSSPVVRVCDSEKILRSWPETQISFKRKSRPWNLARFDLLRWKRGSESEGRVQCLLRGTASQNLCSRLLLGWETIWVCRSKITLQVFKSSPLNNIERLCTKYINLITFLKSIHVLQEELQASWTRHAVSQQAELECFSSLKWWCEDSFMFYTKTQNLVLYPAVQSKCRTQHINCGGQKHLLFTKSWVFCSSGLKEKSSNFSPQRHKDINELLP